MLAIKGWQELGDQTIQSEALLLPQLRRRHYRLCRRRRHQTPHFCAVIHKNNYSQRLHMDSAVAELLGVYECNYLLVVHCRQRENANSESW